MIEIAALVVLGIVTAVYVVAIARDEIRAREHRRWLADARRRTDRPPWKNDDR